MLKDSEKQAIRQQAQANRVHFSLILLANTHQAAARAVK